MGEETRVSQGPSHSCDAPMGQSMLEKDKEPNDHASIQGHKHCSKEMLRSTAALWLVCYASAISCASEEDKMNGSCQILLQWMKGRSSLGTRAGDAVMPGCTQILLVDRREWLSTYPALKSHCQWTSVHSAAEVASSGWVLPITPVHSFASQHEENSSEKGNFAACPDTPAFGSITSSYPQPLSPASRNKLTFVLTFS